VKIVDTFVAGLFAFKFEDQSMDELERLFDEWTNPVFLEEFFEREKSDLFYHNTNVESAVIRAMDEASRLEENLLKVAGHSFPDGISSFFKNLDNNRIKPRINEKQKGRYKWLRIYALRIDRDIFVVTGGAIKLHQEMKDRNHTKEELHKLELCRNYLKSRGVTDADSYFEFLYDTE
jgi:hypothetical protein